MSGARDPVDPINHIIELNSKVGELTALMDLTKKEREAARKSQIYMSDAIHKLTARMDAMPDDVHDEHHRFIKVLIRESEQRQEIRQAILKKLASGGAWVAIVSILGLIWLGIKAKFGGNG